ncbi:sulfatase-like hydrolase/transferase [Bremerella sp. T1]|uniref:sulfatase-like hydrolase/transferase n=1 Tax=Bremerella sp. TYQ1 TaxID=3119568 RepID=UPI001CCDA6D0|nr:sulfatase-like hydrolase/transferase [Bremerella volcania]UBM37176.1 sulfatase-like hydrolase/transferase [Bremerella volcania]
MRKFAACCTHLMVCVTTCFLLCNFDCADLYADEERPPKAPNVLLLVADDLGYAELGCQGNQEVQTPKLDAFSETAVRCTHAYVTAPNCSPSRAGFLTGKFPTRFGYEFNPIGARNEDPNTGLPRQQQTLAEFLHDAGYTTGLVGKWHLGGAADFHPQRHGFDEFYGFLHEGHYFVPSPWNETTTWIRRKGLPEGNDSRYVVNPNLIYSSHMGHDEPAYDANNPILRGGQPVVEEAYFTDAITREATSFIERYKTNPWFLYVAYNAVHSPLQAKNDTLALFVDEKDIHRRIFLAMLYDLDHSVGQIMQTLEKTGQADNTIVFFLSDNGGPTKETTSSNLPLRSGKGSMYEGGIRVPMMVRWPGKLPAGTTSESVVSSLDIFPTVAKAIEQSPKNNLDGLDIVNAIQTPESTQDRTLYWRQGKRAALRQGHWKLVAPNGHQEPSDWELFNLQDDVGETHDLSESPEHAMQFQALLKQWQVLDSQMKDPLFQN